MKETGPEAVPPPVNGSRELRNLERLLPAPEPPLKRRASVAASRMIDSMLSSTELMKQAEHCGRGLSARPTLNQTGLLKAAYWFRSRKVSSSAKASASSSLAK